MKSFRPSKRVVLGLGGGLAAAASAALFMNGTTNIRIPGASDLAAMLQERSPGARAEGALAKKAPMMAAAAPARVPQKQVLPAAVAPPAAAPAAAALTPAPVPISALPAAAVLPAVVPAGTSSFLPGLLPLPLVFGDGGSSTTTIVNNVPPTPTPPGETPPPPAPPIPEPGTWLMMISGFGLLGLALRRRRRLSALKVEDGARIAAYPAAAVRQS